jgi:hypothetical protein
MLSLLCGLGPGPDQSRFALIVYANKRAEMWGAMRAWLAGGMIPDDRELLADLTGVDTRLRFRPSRRPVLALASGLVGRCR